MSEKVAVVGATQREAARAGNTSPLFPSCSFYQTYFFNHEVTFEVQREASRKRERKNLQHRITEIPEFIYRNYFTVEKYSIQNASAIENTN